MSFLGTAAFIFLPIAFILITGGVHKIEEGHVGVYFRGGALMSEITDPGFHLGKIFPFIFSPSDVHSSV